MDEVVIELSLIALEKKLQSEIVRGKKTGKAVVIKENEEKLFVLGNLMKDVKSCIGTPDPRIYDINLKRFLIWPDDKKWSELSDEAKQLIEMDVQDRQNWFWAKIGELYDEYLELLIEAVSIRVEEAGDGEKILQKIQEILKKRMLKIVPGEVGRTLPAAQDVVADTKIIKECPDNQHWGFSILDALRTAARNFCLKALKCEDESDLQADKLPRDQNAIWYDPDFVEPLRLFAFSRKWGERFALLEKGGSAIDILDEVWQEIEEMGLRCALLNALNCWDEEFMKAWAIEGGKVYTASDMFRLHEKLNKILRDYNAHRVAVMWMNRIPIEKMQAITLDELKSTLAIFQDLYFKTMQFSKNIPGAPLEQAGTPIVSNCDIKATVRTENIEADQEPGKGNPIRDNIHWGVVTALDEAAEHYVETENAKIELLKERLRFAEEEGNDAEHLTRNIEAEEHRISEVEAFRDALSLDATAEQVRGLLTDRVRAWLLSGFHGLVDFEKVARWERDETLVRSEQRVMERGLILPDKQFFIYKALELLRGLSSGLPVDRSVEPPMQSGKESKEWIPSDKELVDILCRIRETDWKWADYRANHALAELTDGTVQYTTGAPFGEYGEYLWKRKSYPEIPPAYMLSPKAWRMMALPAVLNDIFSHNGTEANGYRLSLSKAIDDYRLAAKCKLIDVLQWQRDQDQPDSPEYEALECRIRSVRDAEEFGAAHLSDSPIRGWLIEFLGDGERSEYDVTNDEHLVKRVIIAQKLKDLLSSRTVRSDNGLVGTDAGLCVEVPKQIRWRGEKKLLIRLAECLHDDGFVVNPESFIIQFNMDKQEVENPCVWIKSNALLVYLFDFLRGDEMKMIYKNDATDKIIEKHFCKSNYSVISNFKQTRNGYQNTKEGKPKGAEKIDRIVGIVISCE